MTETQTTINQWQNEHFPDASLLGVATHLSEEFSEWEAATTIADAAEEAADIVILLYCWAMMCGLDLHAEIDRKMAKNRSRQWNILPDGTGRHT